MSTEKSKQPKDDFPSVLHEIDLATVKLVKKGGQGVLVSGNLIITAAHCIDGLNWEGGLALGDFCLQQLETFAGKKVIADVWYADAISDTAVLGSPDDQDREAEAFERYCGETKPVALCRRAFKFSQRFPVYIRNYNGKCVSGTGCQWNTEGCRLSVTAEEQIEGGASGGPVVNKAGLLLGINSFYGGGPGRAEDWGSIPQLHRSLPVWLRERIYREQGRC